MNKTKEPLFHIVKRGEMPWYFSWGVRAVSIILALACCGVITTLVTSEDPIQIFATIIDGSFGSSRKFMVLLQNTAMLLCVALALTPAFKMRFWNIGGEGQALAGALWGAIPAFFKAKFGTNETLFTLMMNYVAIQLVAYFAVVWENPRGSGNIGVINPLTKVGWFPEILGSKYALNIIIVALLTIGMYIYLNYSKHGYEISVVGESERTAKYIGIKVEKVIIRTMLISGAICGLAGLLLVGGTNHTLNSSIVAGRGFTAVMVSWLGKFNPVWMILTSLLLVFLGRGAGEIATDFGLNSSFGDILTGIILFFIIGGEFFITYKLSLTNSAKKEEK
ncbi:MAG: ABC transporter permease [Oscillospiraceae bacterium]|nr:ABC transporter permease [Oscillospiraceae bacterium]